MQLPLLSETHLQCFVCSGIMQQKTYPLKITKLSGTFHLNKYSTEVFRIHDTKVQNGVTLSNADILQILQQRKVRHISFLYGLVINDSLFRQSGTGDLRVYG